MEGVLAFKEQLEFGARIARPNALDRGRTKVPFFFIFLGAACTYKGIWLHKATP